MPPDAHLLLAASGFHVCFGGAEPERRRRGPTATAAMRPRRCLMRSPRATCHRRAARTLQRAATSTAPSTGWSCRAQACRTRCRPLSLWGSLRTSWMRYPLGLSRLPVLLLRLLRPPPDRAARLAPAAYPARRKLAAVACAAPATRASRARGRAVSRLPATSREAGWLCARPARARARVAGRDSHHRAGRLTHVRRSAPLRAWNRSAARATSHPRLSRRSPGRSPCRAATWSPLPKPALARPAASCCRASFTATRRARTRVLGRPCS